MNVFDFLLERGEPGQAALLTEAGPHTYADIRAAADAVAATCARLGVAKGDRVAIFADNSLFWVACYLGLLKHGAVAVPFYPTVAPGQFEHLVALTGCRVFCLHERYLRQFGKLLPDGAAVVLDSPEAAARHAATHATTWPGQAGPATVPVAAAVVDEATDLAALMFTSGSTGMPRAVMVTHGNIIANTGDIIASLGLDEHERIMCVLPFYYCFGTSLLHTHLRAGGTVVINNRFAFPQVVLDQLESAACTGLAGVPSTYQILLRNSAFPQRRFPALRKMQQAGGKLPDVFIRELRAAQPQADYYLMYGQTEATARLACLPPAELDRKLGSIGKGLPGVTLRVLDDEGRPVATGQAGQIVASGRNITRGYWQDPQGTAEYFRDGALWTGDIARIDEDGYLFIVDRVKDFLKPSGHRIASKQIEDCVVQLPDVVEAAVVGVADEVLGEAVRAFVVLRRDATLAGEHVIEHCKAHLPPYAVPKEVVVLGAMPKQASGKLDKLALKRWGAPEA